MDIIVRGDGTCVSVPANTLHSLPLSAHQAAHEYAHVYESPKFMRRDHAHLDS